MPSADVELAFATPRKLPKASSLRGRVVVLDIAFAAEVGGASFEGTTRKLIDGLGERLRAWVDHHDSDHHALFRDDPRFVLAKKAEHGACPEMIDPALVGRVGPVDTIVCHTDFDGLASAAKWLRGGLECYPGCDADARAIDTRIGAPSPIGARFDRALRARPRDAGLFGLVVRHLSTGLADPALFQPIDEAGRELEPVLRETERLARGFERASERVVVCDATLRERPYDKTLLLLMGQERAPISMVVDESAVTLAARFDSGLDFLAMLGLSGGMPTRVSVPRSDFVRALAAVGVTPDDAQRLDERVARRVPAPR
jgi:hypothetical protein